MSAERCIACSPSVCEGLRGGHYASGGRLGLTGACKNKVCPCMKFKLCDCPAARVGVHLPECKLRRT